MKVKYTLPKQNLTANFEFPNNNINASFSIPKGAGVSDYEMLSNKPFINGVELVGSLSFGDLGIITKSVDDLTNYYKKSETYTKTEIENIISDIPVADLTPYATKEFVSSQGYITSSALTNYATKDYLATSLTPYATKEWAQSQANDLYSAVQSWVGNQGYITSGALTDYATKDFVSNQGFITSDALTPYATQEWAQSQANDLYSAVQSWVGNQGYITGITGEDIISALGFTPYNATNPNQYITSSALSNLLTTDTAQNITQTKTFVGSKRVGFKQSTTNDKLGFTLYNTSGGEIGYLEFNPTNKIDNAPLMTLGNYATSASGLTQVGFRRYSSISGASGAYNLLTPMIADAKSPFNLTTTYTNFYLPLGFKYGDKTVLTSKSGVCDLSSIFETSIKIGNTTLTESQLIQLLNLI